MKEGDYIGWTGLDNKRFISRDDDTPCNDCSHSRTIVDDDEHREFWVPSVRETPYERIRPSNRQFFFSAAVRIDRRKLSSIMLLFCGEFLVLFSITVSKKNS